MKTIYVYPGTFSPPTFGHLDIARQAAAILPELIILCSKNPDKEESWFTPEECCSLWKAYDLPDNVKIMTLSEFQSLSIKSKNIVIIRGLRNPYDLEQEKKVIFLNRDCFGIKKYFYILGLKKNQKISSSRVRKDVANLNLKNLNRQISPPVINALLEKIKIAV